MGAEGSYAAAAAAAVEYVQGAGGVGLANREVAAWFWKRLGVGWCWRLGKLVGCWLLDLVTGGISFGLG